jgi:hypothetical protein
MCGAPQGRHRRRPARTARRPDPEQLQDDKDLVSEDSNPLVKNLMMWRHLFVAHRDTGKLLKGIALGEQYPLTFTDVQTLLDNGLRIVNRYSILFIATSHVSAIIGHDDYLKVLEAIREHPNALERASRRRSGSSVYSATGG